MRFRQRTINEIAVMICGDDISDPSVFRYRTRKDLEEFFHDAGMSLEVDPFVNSRKVWTSLTLGKLFDEPQPSPTGAPATLARVISLLMEQEDALNEAEDRPGAIGVLNASLKREGFQAFYTADGQCSLRNTATGAAATPVPANPHRPFSAEERARREALTRYLDVASEDELTEEILLPLFRQLGFQRITAAGHKDKALEYGKDVWMKFTLPTLHGIYFGIQVKKGKIDAAGQSKNGSGNVAEIYHQVLMMIGNEVFDPETNKHHLVDHAYIISGGEITKQARAWLANALDLTRRSQIIFMDRNDILNLSVAAGIPVPEHQASPARPDRLPGQVTYGRGWRGALPDAIP